MTAVLVGLAGLAGLAVGSFLNVVVWRVPRGMSVARPASACPGCGAAILPRDNVPVLGWLVLRGRARCCGARIGARYPLVEAATAVAFAGLTWWHADSWTALAWLWLAAVSIALTLIDLEHHRLPDVLTLPSYPVAAGLLVIGALLDGGPLAGPVRRAALGALALWTVYRLLYDTARLLYGRGAFGLGDVKLAGVLGLYLGWLGWGALIVGGFGAFVLGGLTGIALMLSGRARRRTAIPFGPFMILAAWLAAWWGNDVASWYLGLTGV